MMARFEVHCKFDREITTETFQELFARIGPDDMSMPLGKFVWHKRTLEKALIADLVLKSFGAVNIEIREVE